MSGIFPFISTLYLKQQTNILRCLSSLKFENSLFSNKLFRCIFCSERKLYAAENDHTKCFVQNWLGQITLHFVQTTSWLCYYCHKLRFSRFKKPFKIIFHHSGNCRFLICIRLWTTTISDRIHPLNMRKREPYKTFKILNIKTYPWNTLQFLQISNQLPGYSLPMKLI